MPRQRTPGGTAVFTWIAMGVVTAVPPAGSAQEAIRSNSRRLADPLRNTGRLVGRAMCAVSERGRRRSTQRRPHGYGVQIRNPAGTPVAGAGAARNLFAERTVAQDRRCERRPGRFRALHGARLLRRSAHRRRRP